MPDLFHNTKSDALISDCGRYRYWLTRTWDERPPLCFVMLNPSTADALQDDRTIRRCIAFAERLEHGGIRVYNLYAWRSKNPSDLHAIADPVGSENDFHMIAGVTGRRVIAAWGNATILRGRAERVTELLKRNAASLHCLKFTNDGRPWHPLYVRGVRGDAPLLDFPRQG